MQTSPKTLYIKSEVMSKYLVTDTKKITTRKFIEMKKAGEKISMLTAYDFTSATIIDQAGIDGILVGDSAANVMLGANTTLPITLDQMIYHARCVMNGVKRAMVVCDMPFGSYQVNKDEALRNAIRIMKETGVDALKLEGGEEIIETVKALVNAGIPVMGHLGLTPQSVHQLGGYSLQAKQEKEAKKLLTDALLLSNAGCFAIVLEKIPATLAKQVSESVSCPTIGIGAGNHTDGQILVSTDMLGMTQGFSPKFLRRYAQLSEVMTDAIGSYITDTKNGSFPNESESY